jgi:hypothetical protein
MPVSRNSFSVLAFAFVLQFHPVLAAQQASKVPNCPSSEKRTHDHAMDVHWLYGAYVPRDVALKSLSLRERKNLYLRQTYLTWGIYGKTAFFAIGDQVSNSPTEWGDGPSAYGRRFASRYGQFAIQNTFSSAGNALLGYEPRYERCRCDGIWPRAWHALARNFVTYNHTEVERRPQLALYGGALGAGMISSTWKPGDPGVWRQGYQAMGSQAAWGSLGNLFAEFAPELMAWLKRNKE